MTLAFRTYIKDGRTYGGIVDNFRDPATGKSRTTSVRRYGNIDKLKETNPDFMQEVEAELQSSLALIKILGFNTKLTETEH